MNRSLGVAAIVAHVCLCIYLFSCIGNYLSRDGYNTKVVRGNSTCESCFVSGYYSLPQDEVGSCTLHSVESCTRGVYLAFVAEFKCNDFSKYSILADQSKIGQAMERCFFDGEAGVYHSRDEYKSRIAIYNSFSWLTYAVICVMVATIVTLPMIVRKVVSREEDEDE